MTYRRYVALHSSYAASPGIDPVIDRAAGRSGRNYPHLPAHVLCAELTDATVGGATTATILETHQRTLGRAPDVPPPSSQDYKAHPASLDACVRTAPGDRRRRPGRRRRQPGPSSGNRRPCTRPRQGVSGTSCSGLRLVDVESVAVGHG